MRGKKRKIEITKRESKEQRAVTFYKRRNGLFKKAAELSVLSGATMAIFANSPAENSDAIYSFFSNSTSAYEIANRFLNNEIPLKPEEPNPKLRFWWEDLDTDCCLVPSVIDHLQKSKNDLMASLAKKIQNQTISLSQNPNFSPLRIQIPNQIPNQITNQIINQIPNQNQSIPLLQNPNLSPLRIQIPNQIPNQITNQLCSGGEWPDVLLPEEVTAVEMVGGVESSDEDWWRKLLDDCGEEEDFEEKKFRV